MVLEREVRARDKVCGYLLFVIVGEKRCSSLSLCPEIEKDSPLDGMMIPAKAEEWTSTFGDSDGGKGADTVSVF